MSIAPYTAYQSAQTTEAGYARQQAARVAMNTCPVCGYDQLELPYTEDGNICPCCGTEFDYHDANFTHAQLRQRWISTGALWWDLDTPPPAYWSPVQQLKNIGYEATDEGHAE